MSFLFFPTFVSRASAVAYAITLTDSPVTDTNATTYTFSSVNLGAAASPRKIVIAFSARMLTGASPGATSATVGGNSCTQSVASPGSAGSDVTEQWYVDLDTGTSADIVINMGSSMDAAGLTVWNMPGAATGGPSDTLQATGGTGSDASGNIDVPAGGGLICFADTTGASKSFTWTNATERVDKHYDSQNAMSGTSDVFEDAQSGRTITVDQGSTTVRMVCTSWAAA